MCFPVRKREVLKLPRYWRFGGGDEQAAERKAEDTPADVGLERPEHGVEFPQADERKQEQQAEKVRPGKVEGGSEDAHKHGAGDDPRKMF